MFTLLGKGYTDRPARLIRTAGVSGSDLDSGFFAPFAGVADFNGDGLDDLASNGVLLLSRGGGTFQPARRDLRLRVRNPNTNPLCARVAIPRCPTSIGTEYRI